MSQKYKKSGASRSFAVSVSHKRIITAFAKALLKKDFCLEWRRGGRTARSFKITDILGRKQYGARESFSEGALHSDCIVYALNNPRSAD